jgi:hypothetical protein
MIAAHRGDQVRDHRSASPHERPDGDSHGMEVRHARGCRRCRADPHRPSKEELIEVHDAATVSWPAGQEAEDPAARRPHRRRRWAVRSGACSSASCSSCRCWAWQWARRQGRSEVPHRCRHRRRVHRVGARPCGTWSVGALRPVERRDVLCSRSAKQVALGSGIGARPGAPAVPFVQDLGASFVRRSGAWSS